MKASSGFKTFKQFVHDYLPDNPKETNDAIHATHQSPRAISTAASEQPEPIRHQHQPSSPIEVFHTHAQNHNNSNSHFFLKSKDIFYLKLQNGNKEYQRIYKQIHNICQIFHLCDLLLNQDNYNKIDRW